MNFTHIFNVPLHDCDPAGVMFYGHLFRHAHDAYEAFMADRGMPLQEIFAAGKYKYPLVHAEADYRAPMPHGERIEARLSVERVGTTAFTLQVVFYAADGSEAATATTVHACIDAAWKKAALPDGLRALLTA